MDILLTSILAHVIAESIFLQSREKMRSESKVLLPSLIYGFRFFFLLTILLISAYPTIKILLYSLLVSGVCLLIDYIKNILTSKSDKAKDLQGFLVAQPLYLVTLLVCWKVFNLQGNSLLMVGYNALFQHSVVALSSQPNGLIQAISFNHLLTYVITYLYVCLGGSRLMRKFLAYISNPNQNRMEKTLDFSNLVEKNEKASEYIGLLERMLILTLVINDALNSIAFIIAAKSIARYSELNDKKFAEYYLIGTLTSTSMAVFAGLLLKKLLIFTQ